MIRTLRALGYLWAAPLSLLGLLCALPWIGGARWRALDRGCLVFADSGRGLVGLFFRRWRLDASSRVAAITIGHVVILARPELLLDARLMTHEATHALQAMIFGPLFPLFYAAHWLFLLLSRDPTPYRSICFEKWARSASGEDL